MQSCASDLRYGLVFGSAPRRTALQYGMSHLEVVNHVRLFNFEQFCWGYNSRVEQDTLRQPDIILYSVERREELTLVADVDLVGLDCHLTWRNSLHCRLIIC